MRKQLYLGILAGVVGLGLLKTAAQAQIFPLVGTVSSASAVVAANSTTPVFTTPASGYFILTQFCGGFGMSVSGNTFGNIAVGSSDTECNTFNPGYVLPQGETIQCTNPLSGGPSWCNISGILEKQPRR